MKRSDRKTLPIELWRRTDDAFGNALQGLVNAVAMNDPNVMAHYLGAVRGMWEQQLSMALGTCPAVYAVRMLEDVERRRKDNEPR